jgi:hypothetical protein
MRLSSSTEALLAQLDTLSAGTLSHRDDLGLLLDLGVRQKQGDVLGELCFLAKFVTGTYKIMTRIGPEGEGYPTVERQFTENFARVKDLLARLLAWAAPPERERFESTYASMTASGMHNLLALCQDLSWYKNWCIDTKGRQS